MKPVHNFPLTNANSAHKPVHNCAYNKTNYIKLKETKIRRSGRLVSIKDVLNQKGFQSF